MRGIYHSHYSEGYPVLVFAEPDKYTGGYSLPGYRANSGTPAPYNSPGWYDRFYPAGGYNIAPIDYLPATLIFLEYIEQLNIEIAY